MLGVLMCLLFMSSGSRSCIGMAIFSIMVIVVVSFSVCDMCYVLCVVYCVMCDV